MDLRLRGDGSRIELHIEVGWQAFGALIRAILATATVLMTLDAAPDVARYLLAGP